MKIKRVGKKLIILGAYAVSLTVAAPVEAVFQNWQSKAFEPGQQQKEELERRQEEHRDEVQEGRKLEWEESEAHYYQEIAPKDMEEHHDYLMEDHPLQEEPLPDKTVE